MFNLLKRRTPSFSAGAVRRLDPSAGAGQGRDVQPEDDGRWIRRCPIWEYVVAPFKGSVVMVFPTAHAIGLRG